jgi:Fic family protein
VKSDANAPWPAVGKVSVPWDRPEDSNVSRRQLLKHRGPYEASVVPKIAEQKLNLFISELALADEAAVELSRFDAEVGQMVAPFASILLRSEASSSSQIENLTSSPAAIIRAELGLAETANSSLIVSNQNAMRAAIEASAALSVKSILQMHKVLMAEVEPQQAGRLRTEPVWIGGGQIGPHNADYVGPKPDELPELMEDLIKFCKRIYRRWCKFR